MRTRALLLSLVLPVALLALSCRDARRVSGPQFRTSCGEDCPPPGDPPAPPTKVDISGDLIIWTYCVTYSAWKSGGTGNEDPQVTWTIPDTRVVHFYDAPTKTTLNSIYPVSVCGVMGASDWNYGYSRLEAAWAGAVADSDIEFAPNQSGLQPRSVQLRARQGYSARVVKGRGTWFDAFGIDQFNTERKKTATAIWASDNPGIAVVHSREEPAFAGQIVGIARGTAGITATVNGVSSTSTPITVLAVTSVVVTPANWTSLAGGTAQFTARPKDQTGADLSWPVSWSSSNTSVVTVNSSNGIATAVAPGSANVEAMADGVYGTAAVTVTPRLTLTSLTTDPSPAMQYTPFTFIVEGTKFDPASAELEIVGDSITNCFVATSIPCEVPVYGPYQVTSTRLVSAPRTFSGWGPYRVFVRNLATGAVSNQVSFRIEPRYEY